MHRHIEQMVAAFERGKVTRRQLVGQLALFAAGIGALPRPAAALPNEALRSPLPGSTTSPWT